MTDKPCRHGIDYNGVNCWQCLHVERETLRQEVESLKALLRRALEMDRLERPHDEIAKLKREIREVVE